jgi:hypothetical protein
VTPTPIGPREVLSIAEDGEQAVMERDFYRCPNTGQWIWIYRWAVEIVRSDA